MDSAESAELSWNAFSSTNEYDYDSLEISSQEPDHDYDFQDNPDGDHVRGEHHDGEEGEEGRGVDTDHEHEFQEHPEDHDRGEEQNGVPELIKGDIRGDFTTMT